MNSNNTLEKDIRFYHGGELIQDEDILASIRNKVGELSNMKNANFLFGAGTSSDAIPSMKELKEEISRDIGSSGLPSRVQDLYDKVAVENLEEVLNILHAKRKYLEGIGRNRPAYLKLLGTTNMLIDYIQNEMYSKINIDINSIMAKKTLDLYKSFYNKVALRNKDLSRVNIFTTNNDIFNEKALDSLSINFNNGFGGVVDRYFNPARFKYTLSKKVDHNLEKYEAIENMVYLYKLHGSINWIEDNNDSDSLFNIKEVAINSGDTNESNKHVLIYPTPMKQNISLGSPYSDLIREFQVKLSLPNSVLFVAGYSFSDEHINNIIYQALTTNSSLSVVMFGEYPDCPLASIKDNRIYRIFGEVEGKKIHYFENIVNEIFSNMYEDRDKLLLDDFMVALKEKKEEKEKKGEL